MATSDVRASFSKSLGLTGSLFQGVSQASGGNTQDSSSNYPIVQLRSIDSSQVTFLPVDPRRGWSDTSFTSQRAKNLPFGPALVTVCTNAFQALQPISSLPNASADIALIVSNL